MSSSSVEQQEVHHFMHIHPLTKVDNEHDEFTCPSTLVSFMHPKHELQLVSDGPESICNICHGLVEGLYYCCKACGFDVHPHCTQQPQHVSYMPHPAHLLELSPWETSSTCTVCRERISSWRYKCGPCGVNVHVDCVNSSAPANGSQLHLQSSAQGHYLESDNDQCEHTNKGQDRVRGPSKRRRVFRFCKDLTVEIVCTVIAEGVVLSGLI